MASMATSTCTPLRQTTLSEPLAIVAVIGSAGRGAHAGKFTADLFKRMVGRVEKILREELKLNNYCLISGGSAWADHVAVALFLSGKAKQLRLELPCEFNHRTGRFTTSELGQYFSRLHEQFSQTARIDSLADIARALQTAGCKSTVHRGFMARNNQVAKQAQYVLALSWSRGQEPDSGGTLYTWKRCSRATVKIHVSLEDLLAE